MLQRAHAAGVAAVIVTGCSLASSAAARALVDRQRDATTAPALYFTAGVHPHYAKNCGPDTVQRLKELALHERCVAIGKDTYQRI